MSETDGRGDEGTGGGVPSPRRRGLVCFLGTLLLAVTTTLAAHHALGTRGRPFPSLFLDPYGSYSQVRFPTWSEVGEVQFPDTLIAMDGVPIPRDPKAPNAFVGAPLEKAIAERRREGFTETLLSFERAGHVVTTRRALTTIGSDEVGFFFGLYSLVGWAVLASGVVVLLVSERKAPARAYALWAFGASLFFCTFYDYHSTARLVPLFNVGAVLTELGFLWLAWAFPAPPARGTRARTALWIVTLVGAVVVVGLTLSPRLPFSTLRFRASVSQASPVCLLTLVAVLGGKLFVSTGEARGELRSAVHGLVTVPLLIALGFMLLFLAGSSAVHLLLPLLAPTIPFAIAYAIIQRGALHTRAVLSRRLLFAPLSFLGAAIGLLAWLVLRYVGRSGGMDWLIPAVVGLLSAALVVVFGHRLFVRVFFRAAAEYRPTIEQLSDRIARLRDQDAIRGELVGLVKRWLPVDDVQMSVSSGDDIRDLQVTQKELAVLAEGEIVRSDGALLVPLCFRDALTGVLRLGRKTGGALFTSEDVSLLRTMASLGAVALHHARTLDEVESLRRAQVDASRAERTRVVDTLSAEVAHEIGHPLRYFRSLFQDRTGEVSLDPEEVLFARREVDRMGRMLATLETMEIAAPRKVPVLLRGPAEHAVLLLRDTLEAGEIRAAVEVPEDLVVTAEHDPLVQVLTNLLRNAAQAAGPGGRVGVRATIPADEEDVRLDVWDNGPGVSEALRDNLFRVWGVTTRSGGKGLGLMVVSRIVGHLHWRIDFSREHDQTIFRISIPRTDVVKP